MALEVLTRAQSESNWKGCSDSKLHRNRSQPDPAAVETVGEFLRGLRDGLSYCVSHLSLLGLIFFEAAFWAVAATFCVLLLLRAGYVLTGSDAILFPSRALAGAGIALVVSALLVRNFT